MGSTTVDVVVIGAGISGLVCAYRLAKSGAQVLVVDSSDRAGGAVRTQRVEGHLLEDGPNSFASSPAIVNLLEELKLSGDAQSLPMREHDRYVWRHGRLRKVPINLVQFIGSDLLGAGAKMQVIGGLLKNHPPPVADLSLGEYLRPRIGSAAVDAVVKPGLAGIYAQDADQISFQAVLPTVFKQARRTHRLVEIPKALKRERAGAGAPSPRCIMTFGAGVEVLVETLATELSRLGGQLLLKTEAEVASTGDAWEVSMTGRDSITAGHVVLTAPAGSTARILSRVAPGPAELIRGIDYASITLVHVGVREDQLRERRAGFGFLSQRDHGVRALGMIWSDRMFSGRAPEGHRLLTCFYGGQIDPEANQLNDGDLRQQVLADMRLSMGYNGSDLSLFRIVRLPKALPVFPVGHVQRVEQITKALPDGIELLGNFLGGVSVPDRVGAAEALAKKLSAALGNIHRVENLGLS